MKTSSGTGKWWSCELLFAVSVACGACTRAAPADGLPRSAPPPAARCRRARKFALAACVVLLSSVPDVQLVTALGIVVAAMVLHAATQPYAHDDTDRLEGRALLTQTSTLLIAQVRGSGGMRLLWRVGVVW